MVALHRHSAMDATTVIIGAGHAGLAMSRRLTERSIDHVVLERGEVANSWRTERWDSLRLLTPNWMNRLPGQAPLLGNPDGFMSMPSVVRMISSYAERIDAPVHTGTTVTRVRPAEGGYSVHTPQGVWRCRSLVLASGANNIASVPALSAGVPASVLQVNPMTYCSPASLPDGGVLVVGASATGVQLAEEIQRSGRQVTLSVGEHVRMPRMYRGRDIMWWMDAAGILDERWDEVDDLVRARHVPSPQLIGSPDRRTLDLNVLSGIGVRLVGRIAGMRDGVAQFSGSLANTVALADLKMNRLLARLDAWAAASGAPVGCVQRFAPTVVPPAVLSADLRDGSITTIVWATGYRPDYSWLDLPVLDRKGKLVHDGGVVRNVEGLYTLGGSLTRTRRSSYIGSGGSETDSVAAHLVRTLDESGRSAA